MEFSTKRTHVRPMTNGDAADVYRYASDPAVTEAAGWAAHTSPEQSAQIVAEWVTDGDHFAIVWQETGRVIGHIAVYPDSEEGREDTRELGFVLAAAYHRRGIMTEVVEKTLDTLLAAGVKNVWACCFQGNTASQKLIEKCGFAFRQEGEFYSDTLDKDFSSLEYCKTQE